MIKILAFMEIQGIKMIAILKSLSMKFEKNQQYTKRNIQDFK